MKIKAGTRKNVAARAANIVAPRPETAQWRMPRSKLLIGPAVLLPAANVDVTGTADVAIAHRCASTMNDTEFKSFGN